MSEKLLRYWTFFRRLLVRSYEAFFEQRMQYRAAALSYSTMLSVVPVLAILFAIAKGFGLAEMIEGLIRDNVVARPEVVDTLIGFVTSYLDHTKGGVFLGFGIVMLLYTLLTLTDNIEDAFNEIWQVKHPRSPFRKVTDYTAIIFLLPILIFVTTGLSVFALTSVEKMPDILLLRPATRVVVNLSPYVILCLLVSGFYALLPNTKVKVSSALVAGIPAGLVFQLWQQVYIHIQTYLTGYNAIYGSFAAIPLFMIWCQVSWYIVLFGATVGYVFQNSAELTEGNVSQTTRQGHDFLCIAVVAAVFCRFLSHEKPLAAKGLARLLHIPLRSVNDVLEELTNAGVLLEVTNDEKANDSVFTPAYDVSSLTVGALLDILDGRERDLQGEVWKDFAAYRAAAYAEGFAAKRLIDLPLEEIKTTFR